MMGLEEHLIAMFPGMTRNSLNQGTVSHLADGPPTVQPRG